MKKLPAGPGASGHEVVGVDVQVVSGAGWRVDVAARLVCVGVLPSVTSDGAMKVIRTLGSVDDCDRLAKGRVGDEIRGGAAVATARPRVVVPLAGGARSPVVRVRARVVLEVTGRRDTSVRGREMERRTRSGPIDEQVRRSDGLSRQCQRRRRAG